jgi:tetratricopeptide (TPR) repeat protein
MRASVGYTQSAAHACVRQLLAAAFIVSAAPVVSTHGDLHEQIAAASRAILAHPGDAARYLARGELYRAHHDVAPALADFAAALRLDPTLDAARLARGRVLLEARRPAEAIRDLDTFLAVHPDHADALVIRARARAGVGRRREATSDYDRALRIADNPDWFIERARTVRLWIGPAAALEGLDDGVARLGPLVTLTIEAIDCELQLQRHDAALHRLDRLTAAAGPHPQWMVQRGTILLAAGRPSEARAAFGAARAAIDALPPARRHTPQMAALSARAAAALAALDTSGTTQPRGSAR